MTTLISGVLRTPLNDIAPNVLIRVTATNTSELVTEHTPSEYVSRPDGSYAFQLENGQYFIEINFSDTYNPFHEVIIDDATPDPITLPELVRYGSVVESTTVIPSYPEWEDLYNDLINDVDTTERSLQEQIRDDDAYVSDIKQLIQNDRLDVEMAEEIQEVVSRGASVVSNKNVYSDGAAIDRTELEVGTDTAEKSIEIYSDDKFVVREEVTGKYVDEILGEGTSLDARISHTLNDSGSQESLAMNENTVDRSKVLTSISGVERTRYIESQEVTDVYLDDLGTEIHQPRALSDRGTDINYALGSGSTRDNHMLLVDESDRLNSQIDIGSELYSKETFIRQEHDGTNTTHTHEADMIHLGSVMDIDSVNNEVHIRGRLTITDPDPWKGEPGDVLYQEYQYNTFNAPAGDPNWTEVFDYEIHTWRRHRDVTGNAESPVFGDWSEPYLLQGEDGAPGDTIYVQYQYSPTATSGWHDEPMLDGDEWRRERIITLGEAPPVWSDPSRIRGLHGLPAELTEIVYEYAAQGTDPDPMWHTNFQTGDHFRREWLYYYRTVEDRDLGNPYRTIGPQGLAQIVPRNGIDYGIKQATIYLFQRSATEPDRPSGDLTYNFANLTLTPIGNLNGWTPFAVPSGTGSIYVALVTVNSLGDTSLIAPSDWNIQQWSEAGYNNASVYIYQRVPSGNPEPIPPSDGVTFNFATRVITGLDNDWEDSIPAGTDEIWVGVAQAYATTQTDIINQNEWSVGRQGSIGLSQANLLIYQRSATQPVGPTGTQTYTFADGTLIGLTGGWTQTPPVSGSETLWVGTASAINYGLTDTIAGTEWQIARWTEDGLQAATITIYQSASIEPTVLPTDGTIYNYDTGIVTFANANGWSSTPPSNAQGKIYIAQARVINSASETTATINNDDWTDVELFVEDGWQSATINLYQATVHDAPTPPANTVNLIYDFTLQALTTTPDNGWSTEFPENHDGKVWFQQGVARAIVANNTDTIFASELTLPQAYVNDGRATITVTLFAKSNIPFSGQCIYNRNTGEVSFPSGNPQGWDSEPPEMNDGDVLFQMTGTKITNDNTDTVVFENSEFARPRRFSAVPIPPYNHSVIQLFYRGSVSINPPNNNITYTFSNGNLSGSLDGWSNVIPSGSAQLWMIAQTALAQADTDTLVPSGWSGAVPVQGVPGESGIDGLNVATVPLYRSLAKGSSRPSTPTNTNTFNFQTGKLTTTPNNGWTQAIPNNVGEIWGTFATASSRDITDTIGSGEWATATLYIENGDNGAPGSPGSPGKDGTPGKVGPGSVRKEVTSVPTSNTTISADYKAGAGLSGSDVIPEGAIMTYASPYDGNDSRWFASVSYLCVSPSSGTATWNRFTNEIDGDQIVHGTVAAETLRSNTTLTNQVYVGSSSQVRLNGDSGSSWRISAGSSNMSTAPFRVHRDGRVWMTQANVSGAVNATSGSFTGTIRVPSDASTSKGTYIDSNGNLYCQNGSFRGTIYAEEIVGDLVSARAYDTDTSSNTSTTWVTKATLRVRNNTGDAATVLITPPYLATQYTNGTNAFAYYRGAIRILRDGSYVVAEGEFTTGNATEKSLTRTGGMSFNAADTLGAGDTTTHTYQVQIRTVSAQQRNSGCWFWGTKTVGQLFRDGGAWQ